MGVILFLPQLHREAAAWPLPSAFVLPLASNFLLPVSASEVAATEEHSILLCQSVSDILFCMTTVISNRALASHAERAFLVVAWLLVC